MTSESQFGTSGVDSTGQEQLFRAARMSDGSEPSNDDSMLNEILVRPDFGKVNTETEERVGTELFPSIETTPRFNPRTAVVELARYGVTGAVSFVSSSALEGFALTGATLAAGINPLAGQPIEGALLALGVSYIPLITGTLKNAEEAWKSLEDTGTSVSFLAKVGYDLSKRLTTSERIQKVATYLGFTAIELLKEIPWYIGAFGGGRLVSEVSPEHYTPNAEYTFLAGANIFGAAYQYAQAGAVEGILRGIKNRRRIMNILKRNTGHSDQEDQDTL